MRDEDPVGGGLLALIFLTALAVLLAMYGRHEVTTAMAKGYVELRSGAGGGPHVAATRYTLQNSPVRFHIALIPGVFGPVLLASAGVLLFVAGGVNHVPGGHGHGRAVGVLRALQWIGWPALVLSASALVLYVAVPLKVHWAKACGGLAAAPANPRCAIFLTVVDPE